MDFGTLRIDKAQSKVASGFRYPKTIWRDVAPPVIVSQELDRGIYYKFSDDFLRIPPKGASPDAPTPEIRTFTSSTDTYVCVLDHMKAGWTKHQNAKADKIIQFRNRNIKNLSTIMDLKIEKDVSSKIFNASNYATGFKTTVSGTGAGGRWDITNAGATPARDVDTAAAKIEDAVGVPQEELTMTVGRDVHLELRRHPQILDYYKIVVKTNAQVTMEQLKEYFGVKKYLVGRASEITSNPSATTKTKAKLWGKFCALNYIPDNSMIAKEEPSFSYTFVDQLYGGDTSVIDTWETKDPVKEYARVWKSWVVKITGKEAGYLFSTVVT